MATHKKYRMPKDDAYLPLHVGAGLAANKEADTVDFGYTRDDSGENISVKNRSYCELTGMFWAWKNLEADAVGLVHYRRYFTLKTLPARVVRYEWGNGDQFDAVLSGEDLEKLLKHNDVILPCKRRYFIETNYSHYVHAHHEEDLVITQEIIARRCPDYLQAFDDSMKRTSGHRFNMFIMKREIFDAYCGWLFDILFELESRLDISDYSEMDRRVFGFVAERLLDPWIDANGIKYCEIPYIHMENPHRVGKTIGFLKRKFGKRAE